MSPQVDHQYRQACPMQFCRQPGKFARNGVLFAGISAVYQDHRAFSISVGDKPPGDL
jgi:hypothetical protein